MYVNGHYKLSKIIKKSFSSLRILEKHIYSIKKKNRNIKLQFDFFHGVGIIDKAIDVLDKKEKNDFKEYINNEYSFNRENMFICNSKKLMNEYFLSVFSWLEKCEPIFGFDLNYINQRALLYILGRKIHFILV